MSVNVFELFAKLSLNTKEFDEELNNSGSKLQKFGEGVKNGLGAAAKIGGAALAAGSAAAVAMTKQAVDGFAEYEQLVGGVETLFGDSAEKVLADASRAFETAGQSMNEYMETSIQSAAALINSLGGDQAQAADLMNMSITDMADNVNKMGTSMEGVQNAYRGFSRGNFTMLDNLALGFAGTKEGMQELLDKAQELSGVEYNIDSYADIVQAIHVVQEEMGIAGTTAREASETISGSFSALKSAWSNLVTGMARDDADLGGMIDSVVSSAETVIKNIMPVAERALGGIGKLIEGIAPVIAEKLPTLINMVLPPLLDAADDLISGVFTALPGIITALLNSAPDLVNTLTQTGLDMILMLAQGMASDDSISAMIDTVVSLIENIGSWIAEYSMVLAEAAVQIIVSLVEGLTNPDSIGQLVDMAIFLMISLAEALINALPQLIEAAPVIISNLVTAIVENVPKLLESAWEMIKMLVKGIADNLPKILEAGTEIVFKIIEGIVQVFGKIVETGKKIVDSVKEGFQQKIEDAKNWGKDLINNFIGGIKEKWENLKSTMHDVAGSIKSFLGFSEPEIGPLSNFHTYAPDMMALFAKGIKDNKYRVLDELDNLTASVQTGFTSNVVGNPSAPQPIILTVQSILDGKIIAESTTRYQNNRAIAMGGV